MKPDGTYVHDIMPGRTEARWRDLYAFLLRMGALTVHEIRTLQAQGMLELYLRA